MCPHPVDKCVKIAFDELEIKYAEADDDEEGAEAEELGDALAGALTAAGAATLLGL